MTAGSPGAAVARTQEWLDRHRGWAAPEPETVARWLEEGFCRCPDGCEVRPALSCAHGLASWWLLGVSVDRPGRDRPLEPSRLVPHPDRLDPGRSDYVAVLDAHHRALMAGEPGYADPATGLFALTAATLWERGACCGSGCRHCPWACEGPGEAFAR